MGAPVSNARTICLVAASLAGDRGIVRIAPGGEAKLVVAGSKSGGGPVPAQWRAGGGWLRGMRCNEVEL